MRPLYYDENDLGLSSKLVAQGLDCEVLPQEDSDLAIFRFVRSPRLDEVLRGLADRSISENQQDIYRARNDLRTRAKLLRASRGCS